jgi:hypothetical protein
MKDNAEQSNPSTGSAADDSLTAYLKWRDEKIAKGESDVNPFMVWSAGVRYAMQTFPSGKDQAKNALQHPELYRAGK